MTRDLEKYVDGQVRQRKKELGDDIILWKSCVLIISEGSFKKDIQDRLSAELGIESLNGLRSFLESHSKEELENESQKRFNAVVNSVYKEFPSAADEIETSGIKRAYEIVGS